MYKPSTGRAALFLELSFSVFFEVVVVVVVVMVGVAFVYTLLQKFNVENLVVEQAFVATNSNLLRYITRF